MPKHWRPNDAVNGTMNGGQTESEQRLFECHCAEYRKMH